MNYGVTITEGATPWQIFQQTNGKADITVSGKYSLIHLSQELPLQFTPVKPVKAVIKARIALEDTGESILPWQECKLLENESWTMTFFDVPAGGLYRIETYMDYEGWDGLSVTRGDVIHNLGVGDIFVVAGQSNAAGRAKGPVTDEPELGVHLLRNSGSWDLATHPLNETTGSIHMEHFENHNPGHSPWLHFAKRLKKELGYPIGLVVSAYGGSPLRWWNPAENGTLFRNMLEQLADYRIKPKGMLWYQGEAEGFEDSAATYLDRFTNFVSEVRSALNNPELPIITVQLNRCMTPSTEQLDRQWGIVRQAQVDAMYQLNRVYTIPSTDLSLYDFIHNSSESNLVIGERCARCALQELYHRNYDWMAPEASEILRTAADTVEVRFSRIRNWINPYDVSADLLPFEAEDAQGLVSVKEYTTNNDSIVIVFQRELGKDAVLHGAWRMNPGSAIPCDCMRLPMLSFYGKKIES